MNAIRPRVKHICKIIYAPSRGCVSLQKLRQIGSRQQHDIESRPPGSYRITARQATCLVLIIHPALKAHDFSHDACISLGGQVHATWLTERLSRLGRSATIGRRTQWFSVIHSHTRGYTLC